MHFFRPTLAARRRLLCRLCFVLILFFLPLCSSSAYHRSATRFGEKMRSAGMRITILFLLEGRDDYSGRLGSRGCEYIPTKFVSLRFSVRASAAPECGSSSLPLLHHMLLNYCDIFFLCFVRPFFPLLPLRVSTRSEVMRSQRTANSLKCELRRERPARRLLAAVALARLCPALGMSSSSRTKNEELVHSRVALFFAFVSKWKQYWPGIKRGR